MKKSTVAVVTVFTVLSLLLAGCGGRKTEEATGAKAKEILRKASLNMQEIKSVKSKGSYTMKTGKAGAQGMNMKFEMESDMSDPKNPSVRSVMKGGGQDMDMYVVGGYGYVNVSGKGWYKAPFKAEDVQKRSSPAEIAKFGKNAENLKIVKEDSDSYVINFSLGRKFMESQFMAQQEKENEAARKFVEQMLKSMKISCTVEVSKKEMLIERAEINMYMKDAPAMGDVSLEIVMEFTDYNKPIAITLPEEAKAAQETQSLPVQGLPSFGF